MVRKRNLLLTTLVAGMYLLHQDCWNWNQAKPLLFGFVPIGLAYHASYILLAAGMMWVLVKFAWPAGLDDLEKKDDGPQPGGPKR